MIVRQGKKYESILDVGTGSGVIVLSLVKSGVAKRGIGSDISPDALKVAGINQQRLRLKTKTEFIQSDRFHNIQGQFSLIVSNPPYIKASAHKDLVQKSVHHFEPHSALYLPDDEYETWFKDFFRDVKEHLSSNGEFWMEGHELELKSQAHMLKSLGFSEVKVVKDLGGLDRYLHSYLP